MIKIKMYNSGGNYKFKTKASIVLLDINIDEFEDEFYDKYGHREDLKTSEIIRSKAVRIYTIYTESSAFTIEVKQVTKITKEVVFDMIDNKMGIRGK